MKTFKEISESKYAKHKGKTHEQLHAMLLKIYKEYKEDFESFEQMVEWYAEDKFYNMHYVAKAYKETEDWINN